MHQHLQGTSTYLGAKGTFAPHWGIVSAAVIVGTLLIRVIVNHLSFAWVLLTWRWAAIAFPRRGVEQCVLIHLPYWRHVGVNSISTSTHSSSNLALSIWIHGLVSHQLLCAWNTLSGLSSSVGLVGSSRNHDKWLILCLFMCQTKMHDSNLENTKQTGIVIAQLFRWFKKYSV